MATIAMVPILGKLSPPPGHDSKEINFILVQIADRPFYRVAFGTGAIVGAIIVCPIRMAIKRVFVISFFNTILATGLLMTSSRINYDPKNALLLSTTCRLFLGVGVGGLSATIPSYVGEVAKSKSRGKFMYIQYYNTYMTYYTFYNIEYVHIACILHAYCILYM